MQRYVNVIFVIHITLFIFLTERSGAEMQNGVYSRCQFYFSSSYFLLYCSIHLSTLEEQQQQQQQKKKLEEKLKHQNFSLWFSIHKCCFCDAQSFSASLCFPWFLENKHNFALLSTAFVGKRWFFINIFEQKLLKCRKLSVK